MHCMSDTKHLRTLQLLPIYTKFKLINYKLYLDDSYLRINFFNFDKKI